MMPREPSDRAKRVKELFPDWQYLDDFIGRARFACCAALPANRNESYVFVDLMEGIGLWSSVAFTETEWQRISVATSGTICTWKSLSVTSTMTKTWPSKLRKNLSTLRNFAKQADSGDR
jgi:hypothetical protein